MTIPFHSIHQEISNRFPYSPSDRVQELYPSWARPWARLGVAAEGMEEPRSCDIDGSRQKICGFCLGYHVVQHSDQFCPTAIVMIEYDWDMPNWSSNSEDKPLVVQTWHITSKLSYLVIHPTKVVHHRIPTATSPRIPRQRFRHTAVPWSLEAQKNSRKTAVELPWLNKLKTIIEPLCHYIRHQKPPQNCWKFEGYMLQK